MGFLSAPTDFLAQWFRNFDSKILGLRILSMKSGRNDNDNDKNDDDNSNGKYEQSWYKQKKQVKPLAHNSFIVLKVISNKPNTLCIYVCMCIYIYIYTYNYMYSISLSLCIYTYMSVCTYIYIYIYIYIVTMSHTGRPRPTGPPRRRPPGPLLRFN